MSENAENLQSFRSQMVFMLPHLNKARVVHPTIHPFSINLLLSPIQGHRGAAPYPIPIPRHHARANYTP